MLAIANKIVDSDGDEINDEYELDFLADESKHVCGKTMIDMSVKNCMEEMCQFVRDNPTESVLETYYTIREKYCENLENDKKINISKHSTMLQNCPKQHVHR